MSLPSILRPSLIDATRTQYLLVLGAKCMNLVLVPAFQCMVCLYLYWFQYSMQCLALVAHHVQSYFRWLPLAC